MVVTISPKSYIVFHNGSDDDWNHEVEPRASLSALICAWSQRSK